MPEKKEDAERKQDIAKGEKIHKGKRGISNQEEEIVKSN
jgi:hypothetical protein